MNIKAISSLAAHCDSNGCCRYTRSDGPCGDIWVLISPFIITVMTGYSMAGIPLASNWRLCSVTQWIGSGDPFLCNTTRPNIIRWYSWEDQMLVSCGRSSSPFTSASAFMPMLGSRLLQWDLNHHVWRKSQLLIQDITNNNGLRYSV